MMLIGKTANWLLRHSVQRCVKSRRYGGTGLCSYRVRGVGGSCAEHLTVESYPRETLRPLEGTLVFEPLVLILCFI